METLLKLLELLMKKDNFLDSVFDRHELDTFPRLELSSTVGPKRVLTRFAQRVIGELMTFARNTMKAYKKAVEEQASGPCVETREGKWWSQCPEDLKNVLDVYINTVVEYCPGRDRVVARVLASVVSAFMIYAKSISRQYVVIEEAFLRSIFRERGIELSTSDSPLDSNAVWSGEGSLQYACALLNDINRVTTRHLENLWQTHARVRSLLVPLPPAECYMSLVPPSHSRLCALPSPILVDAHFRMTCHDHWQPRLSRNKEYPRAST